MELNFAHFYPDLMNLYGSWGNVAVMKRHLEALGHTVTVQLVNTGEDLIDLAAFDFLFMGAGTERSQKFALADFNRYSKELKAAAKDGMPMFFAGTSMQLLGQGITDMTGKFFLGTALAHFNTIQGRRRFVSDVYGHSPLVPEPVVGFMNSCSLISGVRTPLITKLDMGFGNDAENGPEGYHKNNVFASELTGPLLVKNPALLRLVLKAIYEHCGETPPEQFPLYSMEEEAYRVTEEQLRLRFKAEKAKK